MPPIRRESPGLKGQTTMMTESNLAKKVLEHLRQVPNATPAKLLAEFRRRLLELGLKAKGKAR